MASKRYKTDDIDKFFDYDISIPTRTMYMGSIETELEGDESGTDSAMAERTIKCLHILEHDEAAAEQGEKPITIIMNNIGGDVFHGLAIYDAIKFCKNHVDIKVFGHAMSMGSIILQAADRRIMAPNSRMMIHYGTWDITSESKLVREAWAAEGHKVDKWMEDLYLSKLREKNKSFRRDKLKTWLHRDQIFNAHEAVSLGLADEVLE